MTARPLLAAIGFFGLVCALVGCGAKPTAADAPPENRPQAPQPGPEEKRPPDAPGAADVPVIQGKVTLALTKKQAIEIGYVGLQSDGKVITDSANGWPLGDAGSGGDFRSTLSAPRAARLRFEKFVPHFDFTHLPPGRYFVYARVVGGPVGWTWATVAANQRVTADLKLDESKLGAVEVKVSEDLEKVVRLVPADLGSPPPDEPFIDQLAGALGLRGDVKDGKATISNVPAGKYQVRTFLFKADIEVTAGKTATIELKPTK